MTTTRAWGPWRLDRTTVELHTDPHSEVGYRYAVDLETGLTCAQLLDWIFQVNTKVWATPTVVAGLIDALSDLLRPQATLCSGGRPKTLTRAELLRLVNQAGSQR